MIVDLFNFSVMVWPIAAIVLLVLVGVFIGKAILADRANDTENFFYKHTIKIVFLYLIFGITFPVTFPLIIMLIIILLAISIPILIGVLIAGGFKKK